MPESDTMRPVATILRRETRLAVEVGFAAWKHDKSNVAALVELKNAVDHLFRIEMDLARQDDTDPAPPSRAD